MIMRKMTKPASLASIAILLVALSSRTAAAQSEQPDAAPPSRRPFAGLLDSAPRETPSGQTLDLRGWAYAAYDDNVLADFSSSLDPRFRRSGYYSSVDAAVTYAKRWPRGALSFDGRSTLNRFAGIEGAGTAGHALTASISSAADRRTTVRASQTFHDLPYYQLSFAQLPIGGLVPPPIGTPSADVSLLAERTSTLHTLAEVSRQLTRHAFVDGTYMFGRSDFGGDSRIADRTEHRAAGRVRSQRGRDLWLHALYAYRASRGLLTSRDGWIDDHQVELGVGGLRIASRTTLSAGAGVGTVRDRLRGSDAAPARNGLVVLASAALDHEVGRSWRAVLSYRRGIEYLTAFVRPFTHDTVSASLGGRIAPRVGVETTSEYSRATTAHVPSSGRYDSAAATGAVTVALTTHIGVYGRYLYYHYAFPMDETLPTGLPPALDRHGVRLGVTAWVPLAGLR